MSPSCLPPRRRLRPSSRSPLPGRRGGGGASAGPKVAVAGQARLDFTLADKGTGIRQLCAALDVPQSDVMAFGDNYNDLPMLEAVGHPILMEGALAELLSRFSNRCSRAEHTLASLPF